MIGKLDDMLQFNSEALRLRAQRQEMIASNLANGDTPHYKAVDFKFADALRQATGQSSAQLSTVRAEPMARTAAGHLNAQGTSGRFSANLSTKVMYRTPTQANVDGNTVDVDAERARFADNSVRYEASLRFLNSQLKTMLSAIQPQ
jgi:flagellar basal-body rod protein FlgB